jgi:hypothetical protein
MWGKMISPRPLGTLKGGGGTQRSAISSAKGRHALLTSGRPKVPVGAWGRSSSPHPSFNQPKAVSAAMSELDDLLKTALAVSEAPGPYRSCYFRKPMEVADKADSRPSTIARPRDPSMHSREVTARHSARARRHSRRGAWAPPPRPPLRLGSRPIGRTRSFFTGMPLFTTTRGPARPGAARDRRGRHTRHRPSATTRRGAGAPGSMAAHPHQLPCTSLAKAAVYRAGHAPTDPGPGQPLRPLRPEGPGQPLRLRRLRLRASWQAAMST